MAKLIVSYRDENGEDRRADLFARGDVDTGDFNTTGWVDATVKRGWCIVTRHWDSVSIIVPWHSILNIEIKGKP